MGCATVDIKGTPLTIVISDESVFDPLLSDSLVSTGRLMEAGFGVIFRLPKDAGTDGFHPDKYPLYGGTILTPENPPPDHYHLKEAKGGAKTVRSNQRSSNALYCRVNERMNNERRRDSCSSSLINFVLNLSKTILDEL